MNAVPRRCVIDASILVKCLIPEVETHFVRQFLRDLLTDTAAIVAVPDLLYAECANVLWKKAQRGEVDMRIAENNLTELLSMELSVTLTRELIIRAIRLSCDHHISAYDACYLTLAERLDVPLLTADERLASRLADSSHVVMTLASLR